MRSCNFSFLPFSLFFFLQICSLAEGPYPMCSFLFWVSMLPFCSPFLSFSSLFVPFVPFNSLFGSFEFPLIPFTSLCFPWLPFTPLYSPFYETGQLWSRADPSHETRQSYRCLQSFYSLNMASKKDRTPLKRPLKKDRASLKHALNKG